MKNKVKVEDLHIINKDNFQSELKEFKNLLSSPLFEYIIINNDISSSNPKYKLKEGELIFSEFTICRKQNLESKDIKYTFTTFLVPSIKLHRFTNDEIISFSNTFLRYLTNEKYVYDFNLISSGNSLSYDNIHKKEEFEKALNRILVDGKPFKKENRKSYTYYPKALILPSKKFRSKFEDTVKYFVKQVFDENVKKINDKDDKDKIFYESDKYVSDANLLNNFLNLKWGHIFDKIDNEKYKVIVNEYKIKFKNKDIGDVSTFLNFVQKLKNFLANDKIDKDKFDIEIKNKNENYLTDEMLKIWKQCLMAEENIIEFDYDFVNDDKINFIIKADKGKENRKFENVTKLLDSIISIPEEIKEKDEIEIKHIFYRRINMKELFPKKIKNNIEFYYHLIAKIKENEMKEIIKGKSIDDYLKKASYEELFLKKKNDEEILFGYKFEPQLKLLFDIEKNKSVTKTISLEFGKDLDILVKNEKFQNVIKKSFSEFKLDKEDKNYNNRTLHLNLNQVEFFRQKGEILKTVKEIKKSLLIDEEIGVTYFYDEIFKKKGINIYGTNLKNKLYFAIEELLLEPGKKSEEEVKKILSNANIYDISYICYKLNVDFYKEYIMIKKDEELKERTMTQRLGYVIEEIDVLRNEDVLEEMKNKFYYDLDINKYSVKCAKDKFYENVDEIIKIMKNKCDFIVNKATNNDSNFLELSIIDKDKYNEIGEINQELNKIIS